MLMASVYDGADSIRACLRAAMEVFGRTGVFERKELSMMAVIPLTGAFTAYIALSNLTLRLNSVSFATISKVGQHAMADDACGL